MSPEENTRPESESTNGPTRVARLGVSWLFPNDTALPTILDDSRFVVGRDASCEIRLDFPFVSRRHAEIYRDGPVFAVKDLDSRNGVFLNGNRISHGALAAGDTLRVGDCVGLVSENPTGSRLEELAPDFFGGPILAAALEPALLACSTTLPITLIGETGAGKERVARAIHHFGGRRGGFHAVNCAALPDNLVEAELFGHAKGAFTGASLGHTGRIRAADAGTLMLDEIADLPLHLQPKFLRVLEEGAVTPLGDSRAYPVDVRFVCASQLPLETLVAAGRFRQDLRARLAGLVVRLPPLRERRAEIVPLFRRLLAVHSGGRAPAMESKLAEALCLHSWPDNVRELDLLVRRLLALHGSEPVLRRKFLPPNLLPVSSADAERSAGVSFPRRREHDRAKLEIALQKSNGNVKAAARSLGFSRQRAYRLMKHPPSDGLVGGGEHQRAVTTDELSGTDE